MERIYSGEGLEVRPDERRLLVGGAPVVLGARAFDLLIALIERRDRVVGKDELLAAVWPGVNVEDNNLTVQMSALRKALGPDAIATVAGRGYRFTRPLDVAEAGPEASGPIALPAERSSFIGREAQIAVVRARLATHRLVTLTGIGGAGKTRLALRVAGLEQSRFRNGATFVDLAPVSDGSFVAQAVARACGVLVGDAPSGSSRTVGQRLVAALGARDCLLLIDNCEHLIDACAELIGHLLAQCPGLVVLATSREPLALEGEQVLATPPLPLPVGDDEVTDATRLFVERAQAASASFELDPITRGPVAEICRRLDGIPLGIEFAAARTAHLSVGEIAARLHDRLSLLGGGRGRLGRQQTLVATLDWSHDLLGAGEQAVFRRLSVCAGAFTLQTAEAVATDEDLPGAAVLDAVASLAARSLLAVGTDDLGQTRYRLLETVRLYAAGKLEAAGEAARARARYRDAWLAWMEAEPAERLLLDVDAIAAVAREIDHLRAAATTCVADGRPELLARLGSRMLGFCLTGNWYRAAADLLEQALEHPQTLTADDRVACHAALCPLHMMGNDDVTAVRHGDEAVRWSDDPPGGFEVIGRAYRGHARSMAGSMPGADPALAAASRCDVEAAAAGVSALGPAWGAFVHMIAADMEINLGDNEAVARWAGLAVRDCDAAGRRLWVRGSALTKLTVALHLLGRPAPALAAGVKALEQFRLPAFARQAMADGWTIELAPAFLVGGRADLAGDQLRRAAGSMRRNGVDLAPNQFLGIAGIVEHLRGRPQRSARLMAAARSAGGADREVMAFRTPASMSLYRHYLPLVRATLSPDEGREMRDAGRAMNLDEAFADALDGLSDL